MKRATLAAAALCVFVAVAAPAAVTVDYSHVIAADGTLTTPYGGAIVDTFDDPGRPGWTYTGNGAIVSGTASGLYAAPYNSAFMVAADATNYFTVPEDTSVLWAMVDFGGVTCNYLGLFWGSVDTYNQVEFLNSGAVVAEGTWTGSQAIAPNAASGDQSAPSTNLYVNFYDVPSFDAVRFTSTQMAFEFDNLAVCVDSTGGQPVVPAPSALLLALFGVGLGARQRRRS